MTIHDIPTAKLYFWAQRPHSFYLISPDVWLIPLAVPDNDHVHIISWQVICRPSDQSDGSQDESPRTQWGGLVFLLEECLCRGAGDIVILSRQELPGSTCCTSSGRKVHWGCQVQFGADCTCLSAILLSWKRIEQTLFFVGVCGSSWLHMG